MEGDKYFNEDGTIDKDAINAEYEKVKNSKIQEATDLVFRALVAFIQTCAKESEDVTEFAMNLDAMA